MNIIRYETPSVPSVLSPLTRLSALGREFDRFFNLPSVGWDDQALTGWVPAVDLYHDKDSLTLRAELPGMKKEDIHISLQEDTLTLTGERRQEKAQDERGSLRAERFFGKFERKLTLPMRVDSGRVAATYENGVLTVTLPKAEEAKPRQIDVSVK